MAHLYTTVGSAFPKSVIGSFNTIVHQKHFYASENSQVIDSHIEVETRFGGEDSCDSSSENEPCWAKPKFEKIRGRIENCVSYTVNDHVSLEEIHTVNHHYSARMLRIQDADSFRGERVEWGGKARLGMWDGNRNRYGSRLSVSAESVLSGPPDSVTNVYAFENNSKPAVAYRMKQRRSYPMNSVLETAFPYPVHAHLTVVAASPKSVSTGMSGPSDYVAHTHEIELEFIMRAKPENVSELKNLLDMFVVVSDEFYRRFILDSSFIYTRTERKLLMWQIPKLCEHASNYVTGGKANAAILYIDTMKVWCLRYSGDNNSWELELVFRPDGSGEFLTSRCKGIGLWCEETVKMQNNESTSRMRVIDVISFPSEDDNMISQTTAPGSELARNYGDDTDIPSLILTFLGDNEDQTTNAVTGIPPRKFRLAFVRSQLSNLFSDIATATGFRLNIVV